MKMIVLLSALAGSASVVLAQGTPQAYPLESEIRLEVWNGSSWGNTVNASPGQQVEYRVVINYTGPRTDLLGLGNSRYQPIFSNSDNVGASKDTLVAFPGDGTSIAPFNTAGLVIPGQNMLDNAQGQQGGPLSAYGRVTYGGYGQFAGAQSRLRSFRHGGEVPQAGAPIGSWLRVAGEFVSQWPAATLPTSASATASAVNSIERGVSASQTAPEPAGLGGPNLLFAPGVTNLVVFRHAIVLSSDVDSRLMQISIADGSLQRAGGANTNLGTISSDDRRFIAWHEFSSGLFGSYRTSVAIVPATIVIPTPSIASTFALAGLLATRRRR